MESRMREICTSGLTRGMPAQAGISTLPTSVQILLFPVLSAVGFKFIEEFCRVPDPQDLEQSRCESDVEVVF